MTGQTGEASKITRIEPLMANAVGLADVSIMAIATAAPMTSMAGNLPLVVGLGSCIVTGHFPDQGDEVQLAGLLELPPLLILSLSAGMGVGVLAIVFFKFIPVRQRLTFALAGLLGGATGYILWLHGLGRVIMP